jgi:hypothetical protein
MTRSIAITVGVVNIIVLLISSVALVMIQSNISSIESRIGRQNELLDMVNDQLRVANTELNFSYVHLTAGVLDPSNEIVLANAGMAYHGHLTTLLTASFDEEQSNAKEFAAALAELQSAKDGFSSDFRVAVAETSGLKERIMRMVNENVTRIKDRREQLQSQKSAASVWESIVKVGLSALQFFSLLLLLAKELSSKGTAKPA